ncbi:MAG: lipoprotein [Candidatus Berkiella sp.]
MTKPDMRLAVLLFFLGCLSLFLVSCGQTGPLTLPEPEKTKENALL